MTTSFSGGRSRSTWREPLTMGKQLVNFYHLRMRVECTLFVIYKAERKFGSTGAKDICVRVKRHVYTVSEHYTTVIIIIWSQYSLFCPWYSHKAAHLVFNNRPIRWYLLIFKSTWIYYLYNNCLSPLKLWIQIPIMRSVLDTTLY